LVEGRKICLKLFNAFEITRNLQAEAGAVGEQMVERPNRYLNVGQLTNEYMCVPSTSL